jgi:hypothetical protein
MLPANFGSPNVSPAFKACGTISGIAGLRRNRQLFLGLNFRGGRARLRKLHATRNPAGTGSVQPSRSTQTCGATPVPAWNSPAPRRPARPNGPWLK